MNKRKESRKSYKLHAAQNYLSLFFVLVSSQRKSEIQRARARPQVVSEQADDHGRLHASAAKESCAGGEEEAHGRGVRVGIKLSRLVAVPSSLYVTNSPWWQ
jgi:hypothetical protein